MTCYLLATLLLFCLHETREKKMLSKKNSKFKAISLARDER